jgi:hypothetical protein
MIGLGGDSEFVQAGVSVFSIINAFLGEIWFSKTHAITK